jgi:polysaccharide deacetylase family protein (PEP-CTERM system associated)
VIKQACGIAVKGYRAPSFSITKQSLWALPMLTEAGLIYDNSVYLIRHDFYSIPDAPRRPYRIKAPAGDLLEFPMPTFLLAGRLNMPGGGGAYLRLLPFSYTRLAVKQFQKEGLPVIVYVHPWEIDAEQPRINLPLVKRLRHYTNLRRTFGKLRRLLESGSWVSFRDSGLLNSEIPCQSE